MFGRCRLNAYLHQIGKRETGLRDASDVPETVKHYIIHCNNELAKAVKATCQAHDIEHTLKNVLTKSDLLCVIFRMNRREI